MQREKRVSHIEASISDNKPETPLSDKELMEAIAFLQEYRSKEWSEKSKLNDQRTKQYLISVMGEEKALAQIETEKAIWQCVRDSNHTKSYFECEQEITGKKSH